MHRAGRRRAGLIGIANGVAVLCVAARGPGGYPSARRVLVVAELPWKAI